MLISFQFDPPLVDDCHFCTVPVFPVSVKVPLFVPLHTEALEFTTPPVGPALTVSVDVLLGVAPSLFVNKALYCPASPLTGEAIVYVAEVAPEISVQTLLIFFCHLIVGVGKPLAAAEKDTELPTQVETELLGCVVTTGMNCVMVILSIVIVPDDPE